MSDINQFHDQVIDEFTPKKRISDLLNVLTILTFIGCGILYIVALFMYGFTCKAVEMMTNGSEAVQSPFMGKMTPEKMEQLARMCEVRLPLLITALVCTTLCLVGAIMMRKLNKKGFYLYFIGQIASPIMGIVLLGQSFDFGTIIGYILLVTFIVLYSTQLKYMK